MTKHRTSKPPKDSIPVADRGGHNDAAGDRQFEPANERNPPSTSSERDIETDDARPRQGERTDTDTGSGGNPHSGN